MTSVKSAQFLYQSSYSDILQQFWNLFQTPNKEFLNFKNWVRIDRYSSWSFRCKIRNTDLFWLWKNCSVKDFDFYIFSFEFVSIESSSIDHPLTISDLMCQVLEQCEQLCMSPLHLKKYYVAATLDYISNHRDRIVSGFVKSDIFFTNIYDHWYYKKWRKAE